MLQHTRNIKLLEEDLTTCQERLASYLQQISQRIRNVLEVTRRRCYNVSGTSGKLLEEEFTTYQERLASDLQVGRCCNVSGTSCMLLDEDVTTYINIPGTSFKLLEEDLTTCQERRASFFLQKISQRIRNVLQVT